MSNKAFFSLTFFGLSMAALAQDSTKTDTRYAFSNKIFNFQFAYDYSMPDLDLAKRFGNFTGLGFGGMYKSKTNWIFGLEGSYLFGNEIKQTSVLDNLVTSGGFIANSNGGVADYSVNMRGFSGFVKAGRLFAINKYNKNHGILLQVGVGIFQSKINIQTQQNNIPPLDENYRAGYDRLSYGVAINQFIGYYFQSKNRLINFYAGINLTQAFTHNRRGFNYDTRQYDNAPQQDNVNAIRFGWMIPIYLLTKDQDEFHFR